MAKKETGPANKVQAIVEIREIEGGFTLAVDDPFAEAVLRTYRSLTGKADLKLPVIVPCGEETSIKAVENYLLRSSGGGDRIRAQAAMDWLKRQKV